MTQLEECRKAVEPICMRQNNCWHDTKTIAIAVYVILTHMINAGRKTEPQRNIAEDIVESFGFNSESYRQAKAKTEPQACEK